MTKATHGIRYLNTVKTFASGRACSDTLFHILSRELTGLMNDEERTTASMAGGVMQYGHQCGMLWGSALAAGAAAEQQSDSRAGAQKLAIHAAAKIVAAFKELSGEINCYDITHIDKDSSNWQQLVYFLFKGGTIGCFHMSARYAPLAYNAVQAAFDSAPETGPDETDAPCGCAAMLARKLGAEPKHESMLAGFAGGIGLCGEACGAMSAAVWLAGLNCIRRDNPKNLWAAAGFKDQVEELIARFLKASDYEFRCEDICGKRFANVDEHQAHMDAGGCAAILDALCAD